MKIKNKKGNLHIDWVVSIGIFLTYIILLITFIKPSYEPSFEGDVLVNIVKNRFLERTEWNVTKTFLGFDCSNRGAGGITKVENFNELIPESTDGRGYKVLRLDLSEMYQDYRDGFFINIPFTNPTKSDSFWVFTAEGGYGIDGTLQGDTISPYCEINAADPIVFTGINENKLEINQLNLNEWSFPDFRNFRIRILNNDGTLKNNYCFAKGLNNSSECILAEPPAATTVYGVNLGGAILDKDGNYEQIILNIQVW
ncbi:hypothetical protein HYT56_01770 [Candidatus Woesearchaeota archaeon]|nr:hypothetical protein [Candidatus Woesearchaeota archaeon]